MAIFLRCLRLIPLCLVSLLTAAQITITSPVSRMVFQRNQANQAIVTVAGVNSSTATTVEARFVPLAIGQGSVTAWTNMSFIANSSAFKGNVTVSAGWYRLDVRAKMSTTVVAQTSVNRIGVGEVFVVAGQSNVFGGFQRVASAADDRVSCVDFQQDSISSQLLPLQFSHVNYGTAIGPSQPAHLWGALGDKLAQRLNVPVLFFGAALGGSSSTEWQQGAAGNLGTNTNSAVYRRLGEALLHYIVRTGARAVLWHQGETDTYNGTSSQAYYNNINYVIQKSRQQLNNNPLAWMVSRVSYISGQTSPGIISAQNQLIANITNVFAGPATDTIIGPVNRPDNIHMQGPGLIRFINAWDQSLSTAFFQNAVPFMPADSAALITSSYTLPLTRKQGETIAVASLRSDPHEADNQYVAQIVRASDGVTVYESVPSNENPILVTIPASVPNGQYRLRTRSTHPIIVGTPGEPFTINSSATPSPAFVVQRQAIRGGTADPAIQRFTYSYDPASHGFSMMVQATAPVEVRLERIDGGTWANSNWEDALSQIPDEDSYAEFNYIRQHLPPMAGVGGVEPGRYRLSVRLDGTTGPGLWFDATLIRARLILYQNDSPPPPIPPVLTINDIPNATNCLSSSLSVGIEVSDGNVNSGSVYSVRLSDASGSFASETTIGSGTTSPIAVTFSPSLPTGTNYRLRVVASNPAVASAPSQALAICNGADLSMAMQVSSRTPHSGEPITLTLVLTNAGPLTANGVVARSLLPSGMAFVDSPSAAVSTTANVVSINAGTLPSGTSLPVVFRLKPTQAGFFATSAQITASNEPDPDSQPNSGTGDGQDDMAIVDLRTPDASGPVNVSPNPNQVPLPPVQSNQPPTDPATADLSVVVSANRLVAAPNEVINVTLRVCNQGGATANNVTLQAVLPAGWQLDFTGGLTVSGQNVTGNIGSVPAGSSGAMVLLVRPANTGTLRAQVFSVTPADPDSTPGNGNTNGEDDEASVSVRVR
ncbi:sialate O-acetylesterase [Spirosoma areae]